MNQWFNFFYNGSNSVPEENQQDLLQIVQQPQSSMFYNRSFGCDIKYNVPLSAISQSLVAYSIAMAIAVRNSSVSDGTDDSPDRRISCSQQTIFVTDGSNGERNISIRYFNYSDMTTVQQIKLPVV